MKTVFIDGQAGTTGLLIYEKLKHRTDLELVEIPENQRKMGQIKKQYLNEVDLVILCLPDSAAKDSVALTQNPKVKILDASTAHRVHPDWTYGMPELKALQREKIQDAGKVSNPGCYPTGFLLSLVPLVQKGPLDKNVLISTHAITGYSAGGKKLIASYENRTNAPNESWSSRPYGLELNHKHLPEMKFYAELSNSPVFVPSVGNFFQGMLVHVAFFLNNLGSTSDKIHEILAKYYQAENFIQVMPFKAEKYLDSGFLNPEACNHTNRLDLFVFGNKEQIVLTARLDNLGKGASDAAIQNLNLMLDFNESEGLSAG